MDYDKVYVINRFYFIPNNIILLCLLTDDVELFSVISIVLVCFTIESSIIYFFIFINYIIFLNNQ